MSLILSLICSRYKSTLTENSRVHDKMRTLGQRVGGAGRTGRHLLGAANGRKLFLKIHVKIQVVISYTCVCVQ